MTKVLFMGRKVQGATALRWSIDQGLNIVGVLTDDHMPDSPTKRVALEHELPLYQYETAKAALESGELEYDLAVCFVYWRYIREPLLSHPKFGILNFHPAPLPELKGCGGYNLAVLEGMDRYGVTVHYMDNNIDTGGIVEVREFALDPERETARSLERVSMKAMLDLYYEYVPRAAAGESLPVSSNDGGRYVSRQQMEAMKELKPGDDYQRKARAFWFPPALGAYVTMGEEKLTVVPDQILNELADDTYLWGESE